MENDIRYYSGYIRNWRKLCEELGIEPDCDRESRERQILQKGYTRWGVEIGNHIYGSFAFAIWDVKKQELFCERDQFGTRSFYYYMTEKGEMLCSGSLKELIGENVFVKKINPDALQIYLMFSYPAGEDTLFAGVKKLMPGCCLTWVKGSSQPSIGRYWKAEFIPDDSLPMEEWSDRIHNTFSEIMQEENPEYCESFLSGGVDSSYLLAMSDAKCADSIGYQEEDFDESALSRETAEYLKRDFRRKVIAPQEYFEMIPEVMDYMEQPLGDASAVAFAIGCKEAAKHTNVC
jgi:asparagine synthase (glutamine-hydrolysing)